jgi:signal transduction histidine kinase
MNKERVLVVDQEPKVLHAVEAALCEEDYTIYFSQTVTDAFTILNEKSIDLLIISVSMPANTTPELLHQAHLINPSIGSIAMCTNDTRGLLTKSFLAGAQAVLVKPFEEQGLKTVVEEVLQDSRMTKENMRRKTLFPLFELNKSLVSELDANKIFNRIVRVICIETRADKVSVMLLNEASNELVVMAALGLSKAMIGKSLQESGNNISWTVMKTGKALLLNAESQDRVANVKSGIISSLCVPLSVKGKTIGVINCSKKYGKHPFTQSDLELLHILAGQAAIAIENTRLFKDLQLNKSNVEMFLKKCLTAEEDERRRISTELHDGLAQWMSSVSYAIQLSSTYLDRMNIEKAREEIQRAGSIISQSIKELRRVILDLHPSTLAELGMIGALKQNIKAFSDEAGIFCHFSITGEPIPLSPAQEITIYRILSEALNNVRRHSRASLVELGLKFEKGYITVEIADNGKGFNLDETIKNQVAEGNIGLISMRERSEIIGGSLEINTSIGNGTTVSVRIPVSVTQPLCEV